MAPRLPDETARGLLAPAAEAHDADQAVFWSARGAGRACLRLPCVQARLAFPRLLDPADGLLADMIDFDHLPRWLGA